MTRTYTVNEMSDKLNKSKSTIYTYLQNGKLTGEKINGEWHIKDAQSIVEDNTNRDNTSIDIGNNYTKINENVYIDTLKSKAEKFDKVLSKIRNQIISELELNNEINLLMNKPKIITTSENINKAISLNKNYQSIKDTKAYLENKILKISKQYKEIEEMFKSVNNVLIKYSNSTESVYVKTERNNLIKILNILSQNEKQFHIINENIFNNNLITVRFSSHLPEYFTEGNVKRNLKIGDIIVPFENSEKKFKKDIIKCSTKIYNEIQEKIPKKNNVENETTEIKINEEVKAYNLKKKIDLAKEYSVRTIKSFTQIELHNFYTLCEDLLTNEEVEKKGFIKNLESKQVAIKKALKK